MRRDERGQSSVELAVLVPVVVLLVMAVLQVGLLARDRVRTVHVARAVARAVVVEPTESAARRALHAQGIAPARGRVELRGPRDPGSLLTVTVRTRATGVPLVARFVARIEHVESLVVLVEGPDGLAGP